MYDSKSRYASLKPYNVTDHRGRTIAIVPVPKAPEQTSIGIHLLLQGQRLDHLAYKYLDDPAGYWRICELNDVMLPEALTEKLEIAIPKKRN
ncbi:MAG: hypothetical protein AAB116_01660 [Candidatus Poribacteria bacterium]